MPDNEFTGEDLAAYLEDAHVTGGYKWKGPSVDGVTSSLLSSYLDDQERFRIRTIEGLEPESKYNHRIAYGNLWHAAEEECGNKRKETSNEKDILDAAIAGAEKEMRHQHKKHPDSTDEILKWFNVFKVQFPIYFRFWKMQKHKKGIDVIRQEKKFEIPYTLPNGRVVILRGKQDGLFYDHSEEKHGLWLDEHKTKGDVKPEIIERQLQFDLQTMFYLTALKYELRDVGIGSYLVEELTGVLYNVIRRPLAGGQHSIRQKKGESEIEFMDRLRTEISSNPTFFFTRIECTGTNGDIFEDIDNYERKFLVPTLTQLCDWYDCVSKCEDPFTCGHYRHKQQPYQMFRSLERNGETMYDRYLATGVPWSLVPVKTLYPELED